VEVPYVILAVYIEVPTPFLQDVLEQIYQIDYPKSRLHLWVHNSVSEGLIASEMGTLLCGVYLVRSHFMKSWSVRGST
jgi:hypothetical protein